jgi:hypothetical protein
LEYGGSVKSGFWFFSSGGVDLQKQLYGNGSWLLQFPGRILRWSAQGFVLLNTVAQPAEPGDSFWEWLRTSGVAILDVVGKVDGLPG